ncbi:hypothetical protein [Seonamhaeicola marinus]|nr:hypothetical protein [Seonamhaeicola marinus]
MLLYKKKDAASIPKAVVLAKSLSYLEGRVFMLIHRIEDQGGA